ncbi:MAG: metallophosphoesterase [Deltaproteobacteria bacterium]|nr:metallophosphoesterase [Deltaproteobacteria bacterium]
MPRLVELPERGRLLAATDLQGNLRDFRRVVELFEQAAAEPDGAVLVITGDLVHGPEIPASEWPEYLGTFYHADSPTLLREAQELLRRHPGRVHFLLGNHEHAHIGGPVVSKFFTDEAQRLEQLLGAARTREIHKWFDSWPLMAVARRARLLLLHAAPSAQIGSAADLEAISLRPPARAPDQEEVWLLDSVLAGILWSRTATGARARALLRAIDPDLRVAIYGHDVAREGYVIEREPLLCFSTSFGCFDGDKLYLDWDLARRARSARHVARGGLRPLHPSAAPVFRSR